MMSILVFSCSNKVEDELKLTIKGDKPSLIRQ